MSEWISVEDRLPKQTVNVLISFNGMICGKSSCVASWHNVTRHVDENSPIDKRWYVYPSAGHEVKPTHWQPLPAPPEP